MTSVNGAYTTDLAVQVQRHFPLFEKELRFITLKSEQAIAQLLETVEQQAHEIALQESGSQDLLLQIQNNSALIIKDQIARGLRALWPDKYARHFSFYQLVSSHQQLAEAIYAGWLAAGLQMGGNLSLPPEAHQIPLRKPGIRANLVRDILLKDVSGNEVGFRKGERCILQEKDKRYFLQKIVRKKTAQLGNPDDYEIWPHPFLLPDRRLVQEGGARQLKPAQPLFKGPVSATSLRPGQPEKAWLLAGCYALAKVSPAVVHGFFKETEDRVWARVFALDTHSHRFEPQIMALEQSLSVLNDSQEALWMQWVEKAYATFKGSYDAIQAGEVWQLLSTFLGRPARRIQVSPMASTDWKPDQMLEDLPEYIMHDAILKHLRNQAEKLGLNETQLQRLEVISPAEIHDFRQLLRSEPETWQNWTRCQQERIELDQTFNQQEQALKDQLQTSLESLKARNDLSPAQVKNEIGKASLAWDGKLKKLRAEFKARRAQLDQDLTAEARRAEIFEIELQRLTAIGPRQAGLEAFIKNSISIMKLKYRPAIFQEEYDQILAELTRFSQANPELKVGNSSYRTADLLSILTALGRRQFPARADGASDAAKDYSPNQIDLFDQIRMTLLQGQQILAGSDGRSEKTSQMPQSNRFVYPLVDTLELMDRKCLKIANPLDEEFNRYYLLNEGKLTLKGSTRDYRRATIDPQAGTYIPEFWLDLRELGSVFDCLYVI